MRLFVTLMLALALAAPLGACGKKGPPDKPDAGYPHTYPHSAPPPPSR